MRAVGIKQLKSRLSEYLRLVRRGETILVTDREQVVAELGPPRRSRPASDTPDGILDLLAETGEVSLPLLPKQGWTWQVKSLGLPTGTVRRILDEVREDR